MPNAGDSLPIRGFEAGSGSVVSVVSCSMCFWQCEKPFQGFSNLFVPLNSHNGGFHISFGILREASANLSLFRIRSRRCRDCSLMMACVLTQAGIAVSHCTAWPETVPALQFQQKVLSHLSPEPPMPHCFFVLIHQCRARRQSTRTCCSGV